MHHVQWWFKNILCFAGAHFRFKKWSILAPKGETYFFKSVLGPTWALMTFQKKDMKTRGHFYGDYATFFPHSLFCEILIIDILDQIGDWLRFVPLQDTHLGEVDLWPRFDSGLCGSRWQGPAGAWVWSSAAVGLRRYPGLPDIPGPTHFHKFKLLTYRGPTEIYRLPHGP